MQIRWQDCVYTARIRGTLYHLTGTGSIPEKRTATGCRCRRGDIFSNADAGCRKAQQKQAWKTGRYAGIQYSLSTDKKDSGTKKSYMGIVRKEEIGYSKNSYQI